VRATTLLHSAGSAGTGRTVRRTLGSLAAVALALVVVVGCTPPPGPPPAAGATYRVDVVGETFVLRATSPAVVAQLDEALATGRVGVLGGSLRRGSGGFNAPHVWHLDPSTVFVADLAIELCDGRPTSDLDADPDYWIDTVGSYCPWSARVVARL
jgi:hypothetical protein